MARPLRLEFTRTPYYVTYRGDRREDTYHDDAVCLNGGLSQRLSALIELTRQPGRGLARAIRFPSQGGDATSVQDGPGRHSRTHPAITHVATHFDSKIALKDVAALCRLSPTQFCRAFRREQGASFGQHLLRYRLERERQLGLTPSEYRAGAR